MRKRVQAGDIGHWTMIWGQPLNIWGVYVADDPPRPTLMFKCLNGGSARSEPDSRRTRWTKGFTVSIFPCNDETSKLVLVRDDQVPDWVSVEVCRMALMGDIE
jgi:hypothetical protein